MKKNLLLLIVFVGFVFGTNKADAGLLLEPFAGMSFNSSGELDGGEVKITGTTVGARLGFQKMGFSLGMDGRRNSWNLDPDSGAADSDYAFTQLGFFLGYELPMKVRFWGNYVFNVEGVDVDDSSSKLTEGSGMVFGFGLKLLGWLSFNVEISNLSTTRRKTSSGASDYAADYSGYTISLSIPLDL